MRETFIQNCFDPFSSPKRFPMKIFDKPKLQHAVISYMDSWKIEKPAKNLILEYMGYAITVMYVSHTQTVNIMTFLYACSNLYSISVSKQNIHYQNDEMILNGRPVTLYCYRIFMSVSFSLFLNASMIFIHEW